MDNYTLEGLKKLIEVNLRCENNPLKKDKYKELINSIDAGKIKTYDYGYKIFLNI